MATWKVFKFRRENGDCPVDDWMESREVTDRDRRAIESRINMIEQVEMIPAGWVVEYKPTVLHRLRRTGPQKKALRILCDRNDVTKQLILLHGVLKKKKNLPEGDVTHALNLYDELKEGHGSVEDFWQD